MVLDIIKSCLKTFWAGFKWLLGLIVSILEMVLALASIFDTDSK
jgi:hypothetical protein